jgi:anionic cell wall polymer biosynthesis LytR-Cps2A-Psr (LCP) family protein
MCLDLAVFASLVDAVGGIPITIPFDMTYRDPEQGLSILLKKGKTVLDGSAAEQFVRYRSGYVEGDLGRLDAQKLFFAAAFAHAKQHVSVADAISLAIRFWDDIDMIGNKKEVLAFLTTLWKERNALSVYFVSLPGEAIQEHGNTGAWYYILNRGATCNLLNRFFVPREHLHADTFDKNELFYKDNEQILNIYFSDGMTYHVYAAEEISDINILKKD